MKVTSQDSNLSFADGKGRAPNCANMDVYINITCRRPFDDKS
jgi:hypothetical protein